MKERILKRLFRATVGMLLAGALAHFQSDPKYLVLMPILQATGKFLREKFGLKYVPI